MMYNLEEEIKAANWVVEKVRSREYYAQNLYAALCNNAFQKLEVVPVLKDEVWSCTWRYAGGLIADILEVGNYMDWYCSGMLRSMAQEEIDIMTEDEKKNYLYTHDHYVGEGYVTDEIRDDLKKLGWVVVDGYYDQDY